VKLLIALVVATASGFIALSYEILWIRVYGFATEGAPESFGFLLSAYLTGLALGALFARGYCQRTDTEEDADPLFFVGLFFLPVAWDAVRWKTAMEAWTIQGRPVIDPVRDAGVVDRILAQEAWRGGPTWENRALILARSTDEAIITDDNMAT